MLVSRRILCGLPVLLLAGCGYIGDPLPPALNIPQAVADLRAVQIGDEIVVRFTAPARTTDGLILSKPGPADLRLGPVSAPLSSQYEVPVEPGEEVTFNVPVGSHADRSVAVSVRTVSARGRHSAWSNPVVLEVIDPLAVPAGLKAEAHARGVLVRWVSGDPRSQVQFRVSRSVEKQERSEVVATVSKPEYLDTNAQYGNPYRYFVEAMLGEALSRPSEVVLVIPEDRFAPETPTAVTAVAGVKTIELSWEPNAEADLQGYRVFRSLGAESAEPISQVSGPSFSDPEIVSGRNYSYAISALDQAGNESARSRPIQIEAP